MKEIYFLWSYFKSLSTEEVRIDERERAVFIIVFGFGFGVFCFIFFFFSVTQRIPETEYHPRHSDHKWTKVKE